MCIILLYTVAPYKNRKNYLKNKIEKYLEIEGVLFVHCTPLLNLFILRCKIYISNRKICKMPLTHYTETIQGDGGSI